MMKFRQNYQKFYLNGEFRSKFPTICCTNGKQLTILDKTEVSMVFETVTKLHTFDENDKNSRELCRNSFSMTPWTLNVWIPNRIRYLVEIGVGPKVFLF